MFAPFELQIFERKRLIGTTENDRLMLSAGRHELELVNTRLGYRETRSVNVRPGETVAVNIVSAEGTVRINAPAGAEVFIDGTRVGETPLEEQHVAIGTREILVKHPQLGEKNVTTTVTSSTPADVKIDRTLRPHMLVPSDRSPGAQASPGCPRAPRRPPLPQRSITSDSDRRPDSRNSS